MPRNLTVGSVCSRHCKLYNDILCLEVWAGEQCGVVLSERPEAPGDELRHVMSDSDAGVYMDPVTGSRYLCYLQTLTGLSQGAWDTTSWLEGPFLRGLVQRLNPLGCCSLGRCLLSVTCYVLGDV